MGFTVNCSVVAMGLGFFLDLIFGDPQGFPHVIRAAGKLIGFAEKKLRPRLSATPQGERAAGVLMVCVVLALCVGVPALALSALYGLWVPLGLAAESFLCYQLLATRALRDESLKVYKSLKAKDLPGARYWVSMIVGRDTQNLDEAAVARAAVETVAENSSDGCVAPLFYMALGGVLGGCFCKAVNTMDSMVGYKNERYLNFGRCAARLDDAVNFIPARLAAWLMIAAAWLTGLDGKNALKIYRRDRFNHASPNSAQTEAVCAGALGLRLAGPASYFGVLHHKPTIGDALRPIEPEDILRSHRLLYVTASLAFLLALAFRAFVFCGR